MRKKIIIIKAVKKSKAKKEQRYMCEEIEREKNSFIFCRQIAKKKKLVIKTLAACLDAECFNVLLRP